MLLMVINDYAIGIMKVTGYNYPFKEISISFIDFIPFDFHR